MLLSAPTTVDDGFGAGDLLSLQELTPAADVTYAVIPNVTTCPASVPQYYSAPPSQASSLDLISSSSSVDDSQVPPSLLGPVIPSFRISRRYSLSGVSNPQIIPSPPQSEPGVETKPIARGDFVRTDGAPSLSDGHASLMTKRSVMVLEGFCEIVPGRIGA